MALLLANLILVGALIALGYAYLDLQERFARHKTPDLAFLEGVGGLIDSVEGYSGSHAIKVAELAVAIGRRLQLPGPTLVSLQMAACLHDCGEINLPRDLLKTNRTLTADEWFLLRTHPILGELALRERLPAVEDVPALVRWHHENWDGNGYPDRLLGEEIPLSARILALADAVTAMSSERPYRPALASGKVEQEVRKLAGVRFDPRVVAAWLQVCHSPPR